MLNMLYRNLFVKLIIEVNYVSITKRGIQESCGI